MAMPPNVSPTAFNAALSAWREAVGADWVSMAPFRKTEITDAELAALAAYVSRNFKGS
jgi:mono/diheme cytochrome c family protein